jgi:hypothetical protein
MMAAVGCYFNIGSHTPCLVVTLHQRKGQRRCQDIGEVCGGHLPTAVAMVIRHSSRGSNSGSASDRACHFVISAGMMACKWAGSPSARPTASANVESASHSIRMLRRPYTVDAAERVSSTFCMALNKQIRHGHMHLMH